MYKLFIGHSKREQEYKIRFSFAGFSFFIECKKKLIGKLKTCACTDCENKNKLKISTFYNTEV